MKQQSTKSMRAWTVALMLFAGIGLAALGQSSATRPSLPATSSNSTDLKIRMWQIQVARDPIFWESYNRLAAAYAQKARETGDIAYFQLAEDTLQASLNLESTHAQAAPAFAQLATVHLAEHRFAEAAQDAAKAIALVPNDLAAYLYKGDAELELGNYEAAEKLYDHLRAPADGMAHAGILYLAASHGAGLAWIKGNTAQASEDLEQALTLADDIHLPSENIAWTEFMLGEQNLQLNDLAQAEQHENAALADFPAYHRALAAMGRIRSAQGRYAEAIGFYKQAVNIIPLPVYLAALGDVYAVSGDKTNAEKQYATVEFIGRLNAINQQVYNRELALFYADHDRKLPQALELARKEFEVRHDVYTSDALAWTLLKNHQAAEAKVAMDRALRLGTRDAMMEFHAGSIDAAMGNNASAVAHFEAALRINPHFHVMFADETVRSLEHLTANSQAAGTRATHADQN